jgi:protein subunit release factor A
METHTNPTDASQLRVPDELLKQLSDANRKFHDAREHLEQAVNASEFSHQERINQTTGELRQAEEEVEEVTRKIQEILHPPA